jgi:hypothetical protein
LSIRPKARGSNKVRKPPLSRWSNTTNGAERVMQDFVMTGEHQDAS